MCGRYGRRSDKQHIAEHYRLRDLGEVPLEAGPDWNITPDSMQPVIRLGRDTGERELAFLKWRLVPFWSKTPKPTFESINARADKLLTSGSWREPFQRRRCLIPGEFFYEWEPIDKKTKQPYAVALTDDRLFSFGGIWDRWKDHNTGQVIESFAMITCDPNATMEAFHDRTPLIVDPQDYDRWLDARYRMGSCRWQHRRIRRCPRKEADQAEVATLERYLDRYRLTGRAAADSDETA